MDTIERIGHQLRGNGATYGFPEISETARILEAAALINGAADNTVHAYAHELIRQCDEAIVVFEATDSGPDKERGTNSPGSHREPTRAKRVALIEDNLDNRMLVHAILDDFYQVDEYESADIGLEGLRRARPDVVLLDISMPGKDGVEALREIRADATLRDLPVLALTAHAMAGDRRKFLTLGFDDYISKPILDEEILLGKVAHWVERPE